MLGGLHHPGQIGPGRSGGKRAGGALTDDAGVAVERIESSLYFRDPDGARVELISDPLGDLYGNPVL